MPKNPNLNIARYKVAGGELNQFEFNQNQQALVEQQQHEADNLIPGTPPEQSQTAEGGLDAATALPAITFSAKTRSKLPPKTRRQAGTKKATTKKSVSQKGREKSTKKSSKKTKPAKRSTASKGRPAKKAAKRSTKKAAKKTGTKKK